MCTLTGNILILLTLKGFSDKIIVNTSKVGNYKNSILTVK